MVMPEHTAKAFDVDLQELTRMVAEMGGLAERQIADAVDALARRDADRAQRTVAGDPSIDALQAEIEEKAVLTIARRQPMAVVAAGDHVKPVSGPVESPGELRPCECRDGLVIVAD